MKKKIFLSIILILLALFSYSFNKNEKKFSREGFSMNTLIRMTVYADDEKILDGAYDLLNKLDKELSMYDLSSDISKINSNAGIKKFKTNSDVIEVIKDSKKLYDLTDGVFNPLIGPVTRLWKINNADNTIPSPESLDAAIKLSDIKNLEINNEEIFLKVKGCVLDLGGIAKGFASAKIAEFFRDKGIKAGLIDLGGNIYVIGKKLEDNSAWNIGVRDPSSPYGVPAIVLSVNDTSVITSGGYERYKTVNGKKYSHFFDTKTGKSITNDLLSATVVTPDGSLADGLATAFMASGYEKSLEMLKNKKIPSSTGVILIRLKENNKLEISATENLKKFISRAKYEIKIIK